MLYIIFTLYVANVFLCAFNLGFKTETRDQVVAAFGTFWFAACAGTIYPLLP